jgi:hypothetical protein
MEDRLRFLVLGYLLGYALLWLGWACCRRSFSRVQIACGVTWGVGTAVFLWGVMLVAWAHQGLSPSQRLSPYPKDSVAYHAYMQWYEHLTENVFMGLSGLLLVGVTVSLGIWALLSARRRRSMGSPAGSTGTTW